LEITVTRRGAVSGVTLIEMLIVVALIGLLAGVTFPSVSAGVDTMRLNSATGSVSGLFNEALNRAERRQQVVELTISKSERALSLRSTEPGYEKKIILPEGVSIRSILPETPQAEEGPRRFLLYPGGAVPRIGIEMANARNARRIVRLDPITGVPRIERVEK
jgi:prepilin-type N-terminal cleavage/methylation domain-containing protein